MRDIPAKFHRYGEREGGCIHYVRGENIGGFTRPALCWNASPGLSLSNNLLVLR